MINRRWTEAKKIKLKLATHQNTKTAVFFSSLLSYYIIAIHGNYC